MSKATNMDSAPRDGRYVLLQWHGKPSIVSGFWNGLYWQDCWGNMISGVYHWHEAEDPHRLEGKQKYNQVKP
jgi:hypothetical protein